MNEAERLSKSVDVELVYRHVMSDLSILAGKRGLRLEPQFLEPRIQALELGVVLLMRNLIGNAIRHTPQGGTISVHTQRKDGVITLTVEDSGPGIPAETRHRVFERFYRMGKVDNEGVGLGMSIVQSVVEAHRAVIQLLESPLGGLRVQVQFPASEAT
jgi:signal transduction histidine kinase